MGLFDLQSKSDAVKTTPVVVEKQKKRKVVKTKENNEITESNRKSEKLTTKKVVEVTEKLIQQDDLVITDTIVDDFDLNMCEKEKKFNEFRQYILGKFEDGKGVVVMENMIDTYINYPMVKRKYISFSCPECFSLFSEEFFEDGDNYCLITSNRAHNSEVFKVSTKMIIEGCQYCYNDLFNYVDRDDELIVCINHTCRYESIFVDCCKSQDLILRSLYDLGEFKVTKLCMNTIPIDNPLSFNKDITINLGKSIEVKQDKKIETKPISKIELNQEVGVVEAKEINTIIESPEEWVAKVDVIREPTMIIDVNNLRKVYRYVNNEYIDKYLDMLYQLIGNELTTIMMEARSFKINIPQRESVITALNILMKGDVYDSDDMMKTMIDILVKYSCINNVINVYIDSDEIEFISDGNIE